MKLSEWETLFRSGFTEGKAGLLEELREYHFSRSFPGVGEATRGNGLFADLLDVLEAR